MWVIQFLLLGFLTVTFAHKKLEVTAPSGKLLGSTLTTRLGKTIYAFRGIRYAQAPVDELRFKPPVPIETWSGIYNATADGPVCPQPGITPVSEDCLFLNVYTTQLPDGGHCNSKRPVIVHLHAGGFYSATGRSNWAGPHYFLDQDIVLVTLNYRVGSLGFISVGKEAPGNNGLKDQVVALKWVKKNIAAFGGDPNSVTLYGYSAGSWAIHLHMVSPMSRGLFHKGIISSGSALGHWPLPRNQVELAKKQARIVGCPDNSVEEIMKCLKTVPAEDLGNSLPQFREFGFEPILIWSPVIEEDYGQERFLHDNPIKLIKNGNFQQIPIVAGMTKNELGLKALFLNETLLSQLSNNFEKYAPICFIYERDTEKSREVSRAVRKFYLGDGPLSNDSLPQLAKIYIDSIETFPINRGVRLIAEKSSKPVYYYEFTYQGRYSHYYLPGTNNKPYGVVHHDDLMYIFYISPLFPYFNQSDPESKMVEKYTTLWANFAKTGNPIPEPNAKLDGVKWEAYDDATRKYLDIGDKLVLKNNMFEDRLPIWRQLYPLSLYQ